MATAEVKTSGSTLKCRKCGALFPSKTQLFKHLRTDLNCNSETGLDLLEVETKVVIIFGFYGTDGEEEDLIRQLVDPSSESWETNKGYSRASMNISDWFSQDVGVSASYDVLTFSKCIVESQLKYNQEHNIKPFDITTVNEQLPDNIQVYCCHYAKMLFHAFNGVQQRTYSYLVPLRVILPDHIEMTTAEEKMELYGKYDPSCVAISNYKPAQRFHEFYKYLKRIIRLFQGDNRHHNYVPNLTPTMEQSAMNLKKIRAKKLLLCGEEYVEFSFIARRFIQHQISHVMGMIIAICRGYLSEDYINFSHQDTGLTPVPKAPKEFMYLSRLQYWKEFLDFTLFQTRPLEHVITSFEEQILVRLNEQIDTWDEWAVNYIQEFCETKCMPSFQFQTEPIDNHMVEDTAVPKLYTKALTALRHISESGTWPETSSGRLKVIEEKSTKTGGSFSMGYFPLDEPRNEFLQEMYDIFELETLITPHRPPSSTVAINRHAQFKPHYDKGDGSGQSVSCIVGLGNYAGGELYVEGDRFDIRYQPLEFNGCLKRHWTRPFVGERFSLVFFTPVGCENKSGLEYARQHLEHQI